jgi:hypothetical protein
MKSLAIIVAAAVLTAVGTECAGIHSAQAASTHSSYTQRVSVHNRAGVVGA